MRVKLWGFGWSVVGPRGDDKNMNTQKKNQQKKLPNRYKKKSEKLMWHSYTIYAQPDTWRKFEILEKPLRLKRCISTTAEINSSINLFLVLSFLVIKINDEIAVGTIHVSKREWKSGDTVAAPSLYIKWDGEREKERMRWRNREQICVISLSAVEQCKTSVWDTWECFF